MPTQIAATPVVKGPKAEIIANEAKRRPTDATKRGEEVLRAEFAPMKKETAGNSPRLR